MAVLSIGIGIALSLKKQTPLNASSQENVIILDNLDNDIIDDVENPNSDTEQAEKKQDLTEDPNATSYDDELASEDDEEEGEEGKSKVLQEKLPEEAEQLISDIVNIADEALRIQDQFSYVVTKDDKLSDVLEQSGLGDDDARALILQYPELGKLEVGQQFYWVLDNFGELEYLNWLVSEKEERIYERQEHGKFSYQRIEKKGVWRQDVVEGEIQGSFTTSLRNVGLSDRQIKQLAVGLQSQIATSKLKNGDSFAILVRREYINDTVTDIGNVEGILIESGNKRYYAIQASDGRYYSNYGVPMGTPIIAPSDGIVEHVAFQAKGAGRYIKIRHGHITTVYMHLSKPLVKKGQTVRKGERIALSGNSGGSTGPHLHYEFHINGRPVNPMTVKLPGSGSDMASKDRKNFLERVKNVQAKLKL